MVNEKTKWGFTDEIDWPRVCKELEESGCAIGLVTVKGKEPITLVNWGSRCFYHEVLYKASSSKEGGYVDEQNGDRGTWVKYRGDWVKAFLDVRPVTVKGYK